MMSTTCDLTYDPDYDSALWITLKDAAVFTFMFIGLLTYGCVIRDMIPTHRNSHF